MIDSKTQRLSLPLPNVDNYLEDDVVRLSEALTILDNAATVGDDGRVPVEQLPAGMVLTDESGKIQVSQIPAVALTDTFPVNSEAAMLALEAQPGDVAIRNDLSKSFILMAAPATMLGNWKEIVNDALVQLAKTSGADKVGAEDGKTVQWHLDSLDNQLYSPIPNKYKTLYSAPLVANINPQGLAQDSSYWYLTEDTTGGGSPYTCTLSRINKTTNVKETFPATFNCHGQGIGVLADGRIIIGGSANSKLAVVDFNAGTQTEADCVGLMKDFPFCYDQKRDLIYQLQDADATSANITRIAVLDRVAGFIADNSIDRKLVKPAYPQGITTDGHYLYVVCGNSWSSTSTGAWNDTWVCYKATLSGKVLERVAFRRIALGALVGKATVTSHEPQAVSWFEGELSFLHYIGDSAGTVAAIVTSSDQDGVAVRSVPKNLWEHFYSLEELGINPASLAAGSSIVTISNAMPDNSSVRFSVSNEVGLAADFGIPYGVAEVIKINSNRIYAHAVEASSNITAARAPLISSISVYGGVQSPYVLARGAKAIALGYEGTVVATAPSAITISGLSTCNEVIINITHGVGTNPVTPVRFTKQEIDFYVTNGVTLYLGDGTGFMSCSFTTTGLAISGVTGSPIVRRVLVM